MSYKTLYRVFRPRVFDDVAGQAHITDILKKQVESGKASHAYMFCGPRGTGKTSTAKILANALNCLDPKGGNPCGECEVCRSFLEDSFVDIVEIDAASNNGVDNVRDIREKVSLMPAGGKYKVYIIDEVHMLSTGAFNALLKTLEEPPPHAVFILATTEQRKVPATILSRCQKYDFRRITDEDIIARMKFVAAETGAEYTDDALALIARQAEGAMRDALSIMDQCIAASCSLTVESVSECMGIAPGEVLERLVSAILGEEPSEAVVLLNTLLGEGVSPHNLLRDMIAETANRLASARDDHTRAGVLRSLEALIAAQPDMRYSAVPSAVVLAAVVRASMNTVDVDTKDFELRIRKLEQRVEKLAAGGMSVRTASAPTPTATQPAKQVVQPALQVETAETALPDVQNQLDPDDVPPWEDEQEYRQKQEQAAAVKAQKAKQAANERAAEQAERDKAEQAAKEAKESRASAETIDSAGALAEMRAAIMRENPLLTPSISAVDSIEVKGGKVLLYTSADNRSIVDMLAAEAYRKSMAAMTSDIFGRELALEAISKDEAADEGDIQMELIAMFGEENVQIVDE